MMDDNGMRFFDQSQRSVAVMAKTFQDCLKQFMVSLHILKEEVFYLLTLVAGIPGLRLRRNGERKREEREFEQFFDGCLRMCVYLKLIKDKCCGQACPIISLSLHISSWP